MSIISWLGGDGDFLTAADWSTGSVPGTGDAVRIVASGTYTVTSTASVTVNSIATALDATLSISAGVFQIVTDLR